jgi:DNA repair protein RecN (Recombination protein N)
LCITHLPQLAAYGDRHFHVAKQAVGRRTVTTVEELAGDERIAELARMIGTDSEIGRASVLEMMDQIERAKRAAA